MNLVDLGYRSKSAAIELIPEASRAATPNPSSSPTSLKYMK